MASAELAKNGVGPAATPVRQARMSASIRCSTQAGQTSPDDWRARACLAVSVRQSLTDLPPRHVQQGGPLF